MQSNEEIWKDVVGYEGLYKVSSEGNVKSFLIYPDGAPLKPFNVCGPTGRIYYRVALSKKGSKLKSFYVHVLVADAFIGLCPGKVTDHINNISTDNRLCNLQRVTNRFNTAKDLVGSSRFIGVCLASDGKNWRAQISVNHKRIHLGSFKNEAQAGKAYQDALIKYNLD